MLVAWFREGSVLSGAVLHYDEGCFSMGGYPVEDEQVVEWNADGDLEWTPEAYEIPELFEDIEDDEGDEACDNLHTFDEPIATTMKSSQFCSSDGMETGIFEGVKAAVHSRRGEVLFDLGQYEGALDAYDRSLELQSGDPGLHLARARVLGVLGRTEGALIALMHALDISPLSESAHIMDEVLPYLSPEQRITAFECALARWPDDTFANWQRAKLLYELGRYQDALAALNTQLERGDGYGPAYLTRGKILQSFGRSKDALDDYARALQYAPFVDFAEVYGAAGEVLVNVGAYEEALDALDTSLETRPESADAHRFRGDALLNLGRKEEAISAWSKSLELHPDDADLLERLCYELYEAGHFQQALAAFDQLLELSPDHYRVSRFRELRDHALYSIGPDDDVLDEIDDVLEQRSNEAIAHRIRGRFLWLRTNRNEEALASLDRSLQLQQDCETYVIRGRVLEKLGRLEEALVSYDRALTIQRDPEAHSQRGLVLRRLGRNAEALVALDASLAMRPDDIMTQMMRDKVTRALVDPDEDEDAPESFSGVDIPYEPTTDGA